MFDVNSHSFHTAIHIFYELVTEITQALTKPLWPVMEAYCQKNIETTKNIFLIFLMIEAAHLWQSEYKKRKQTAKQASSI